MIAMMMAKILPWIVGAIGIIAGVFMIRRDAKMDVRRETALEAAERYAKTRKAMDDVEDLGDDHAVIREWLRERGKSGGDL